MDEGLRTRALELFQAIAHPDRLLTLMALGRAEATPEGGVSAGELAELCGAEQSAMSHQLRRLKDSGLVRTRRNGRRIYYALNDQHVARIIEDALEHVDEVPKARRKRSGSGGSGT
ncbi:MAG: helix-turn-helix transcriptional regulator [Deltaproteobacteria bacterium]|nr:helix-turn-helix transcriptional regulator [Deltaproteobacteria bacterium]